ncbi:MAG: hypothetical protein ACR2IB_01285 [Pyrinomonadaceae bacterium]
MGDHATAADVTSEVFKKALEKFGVVYVARGAIRRVAIENRRPTWWLTDPFDTWYIATPLQTI